MLIAQQERSVRRSLRWILVLFITTLSLLYCRPPLSASNDDVLKTLRPGHPRIYVLDSQLPAIRKLTKSDPEVKRWYGILEERAEKMLMEPTVEHKLIGPRLLDQSRTALDRISTLGFLYRLDGDRRKAERAKTEMLAAAAFSDWNPSHFLDTAEMTHALALGYDWLYSYLAPTDRKTIREAIVEKGLKPGLASYNKESSWAHVSYNWNQVCNGGMTLGALAIADEEPEISRQVIDYARSSIVMAMRSYAPDGGWEEGPGYWDYATVYTTYFLAGVESALGTDFGLSQMPGFADAGIFRIHSIGPLRLTFNFADAEPEAGTSAEMFWLAKKFHRPLYAKHERSMVGDHPESFHLIWSLDSLAPKSAPEPDRGAIFRAVNAAFFRSAWDDPKAIFIGFKGGDNAANHGHLDLGTFVLDALGQRWALDLGPDDYNLPGYFGKERWSYYRLRTEGHNTLTLDDQYQNLDAKAPLIAYLSTPNRSFAVADLSAAYEPAVSKALRGVELINGRQVLVQDELMLTKPVKVVWNFHTRAKIDLDLSTAILTQGDSKLVARILSPKGAKFEVISADPPPPEGQQPDVRNLIICLPRVEEHVRLAVTFAPSVAESQSKIAPLEAWIKAGQ